VRRAVQQQRDLVDGAGHALGEPVGVVVLVGVEHVDDERGAGVA
jgi:hypothetical protein